MQGLGDFSAAHDMHMVTTAPRKYVGSSYGIGEIVGYGDTHDSAAAPE